MKNITSNFLLLITLFFSHCSLYSMQKFEGRYEQFLEEKKQQTSDQKKPLNADKFFNFKEKLENNLIMETKITVYSGESVTMLCGKKEILNPKLKRDKGLIASLDYTVYDKNFPETCECTIHSLETEKSHRKKGYATWLLRDLEEELIQAGCSSITLTAVTKQIPFYTNRGFIVSDKNEKLKKIKTPIMIKDLT